VKQRIRISRTLATTARTTTVTTTVTTTTIPIRQLFPGHSTTCKKAFGAWSTCCDPLCLRGDATDCRILTMLLELRNVYLFISYEFQVMHVRCSRVMSMIHTFLFDFVPCSTSYLCRRHTRWSRRPVRSSLPSIRLAATSTDGDRSARVMSYRPLPDGVSIWNRSVRATPYVGGDSP
jgi:hypothetical protein